jgi:hypothetical protein
MNLHQVADLKLLYEAVYDDVLREKAEDYNNVILDEDLAEVATEYFYTYGLNEDGVDILIEKVGLENFVEFVYDLSQDLDILTEARAAKRRKGGPSVEEVKAKIDAKEAAKKKAKEAAQERKETERKEPESRGADTEAKKEQPKSKKPIRDAIARQVLAGMKRHREATQTAGRLAKETGKTLGKIASVTHEAGRRAGEHVKKHGLKSLANEEVDNFDIILDYLVAEGFVDTNQEALDVMANMTKDEIDEIIFEKTRYAKETGINYRKQKPQPKGGSAKDDKAFQMVSKMMGSGRVGVEPRGKKKVRGEKPPAAGERGSERKSPAQEVQKRRASAQRSQEMQSSRFD